MFIAVLALLATVALSGILIAVVATTAGRLEVKHARWGRVAEETSRYLNGQGDVPKFLERLDHKAH